MMTRMGGWCRGWLFLGGWLLAVSCQEKSEPSAGSESHFLEECAATCGASFECVCGVCTKTCAEDTTCAPLFPSAECVAVAERPSASACPGTTEPAFCDVRCATDAECAGLGASFGCQAGFCREGADSSNLFPNGRVEVAQLCAFYERHVCRAKLECFDWRYRDLDDCMATQECSGWDLFNRELAAGAISYDPVKTYECHQRLEADACDLGLMFDVPSLSEALAACDAVVGTVPQGQGCVNSAECAGELICDRTMTCPGVCSAPKASPELGSVPLGGACGPVICLDLDDDPTNDVKRCEQCQEGLVCYKDTCRVDWQLGEGCSDPAACWPKLWCDVARGQCVPSALAGEACDGSGFNAPRCVDGYFCSAPRLQVGSCLPKSATGGPCVDQYSCIDADHERCIPAETPGALGVCGPAAGVGSPCRYREDCATAFCAADQHCREPAVGAACGDHCGEGFDCVNALCVTERFAGDECGPSDACQQSLCQNGVCTVQRRIGEACAASEDCLSRRCTQGACSDGAECAP
jgi:hypothetical protein